MLVILYYTYLHVRSTKSINSKKKIQIQSQISHLTKLFTIEAFLKFENKIWVNGDILKTLLKHSEKVSKSLKEYQPLKMF